MVCLGILAGIPAIILGHMSRKSIRESMGRLKGEGQATAGMVMGYISVALIPVILIIAAIAIPSLLRSRMAANDAAAASTLRTVNTSQVAYLTQYPQAGYARDMASMGPGSVDCSIDVNHSSDHACLLSAPIASEQCIATNWCANKYGFQFAVTGICVENQPCSDYIATAVPLQMGASGTRSFCSTSDGVVRYKRSDPPAAPITSVEECNGWAPIS
jgi:type II secretory pathway pseudopilin PulG